MGIVGYSDLGVCYFSQDISASAAPIFTILFSTFVFNIFEKMIFKQNVHDPKKTSDAHYVPKNKYFCFEQKWGCPNKMAEQQTPQRPGIAASQWESLLQGGQYN